MCKTTNLVTTTCALTVGTTPDQETGRGIPPVPIGAWQPTDTAKKACSVSAHAVGRGEGAHRTAVNAALSLSMSRTTSKDNMQDQDAACWTDAK